MKCVCVIGLGIWLGLFVSGVLHAQGDGTHCLSMTIWKNDIRMPEPNNILVLDATHKVSISRDNGKYCLPAIWAGGQKVDLSFTVGDERLYVGSMLVESFQNPWRIFYGESVNHQIPRRPRPKVKAACRIEIEAGEPEIGMLINPCVAPADTHK